MQFLIIGKDGSDKKAMERRIAIRPLHVEYGIKMRKLGNRLYGGALLDKNNKMIGSLAVMNFPSEKELKNWLADEPYVKGDVWKSVEITKCQITDPWQFNRPKSFFEKINIK